MFAMVFCFVRLSTSLAAAPKAEARSSNGVSGVAAARARGGSNGALDSAAVALAMGRLHDSDSEDSATSPIFRAFQPPVPSPQQAVVKVSAKGAAAATGLALAVANTREPAAAATFRGSRTPRSAQRAVAVLPTAASSEDPDYADQAATGVVTGAAPKISNNAPLSSGSDGGRPVDEQLQPCAAGVTTVRPQLSSKTTATGAAPWRQATGSMEVAHDLLSTLGRPVHHHRSQQERASVPRSSKRRTTEEERGRESTPTATARAAPATRRKISASAAAASAVSQARGKNRAEKTRARAGHPPSVWVAQHLDRSSRHGVAFLMSDGSVMMRFKDNTVMASEPMPGPPGIKEDRGAVEYHVGGGGGEGESPQQEHQTSRTRYTMQNVPPHLEKKKGVLVTFRRRLHALAAKEGAGHGGGDKTFRREDDHSASPWVPSILVQAYRPAETSCLFVLSDSTIQVRSSRG